MKVDFSYVLYPDYILEGIIFYTSVSLTVVRVSSRCVFVRLASIAVLLISLWTKISSCTNQSCQPCGYNYKEYPVNHLFFFQFLVRQCCVQFACSKYTCKQ